MSDMQGAGTPAPTGGEAPPTSSEAPPTFADARASARERLDAVLSAPDGPSESIPGAPPSSPWENAGLTPEQVWQANVELAGKLGEHQSRYQRFGAFEKLHPDDAEFMLGVVDAMGRGDRAAIADFAPTLRDFLDEYADEFDPFDRGQFETHVQQAFDRVQTQHAARDHEWQARLADANQRIEAHIAELEQAHGLSKADVEEVVRRAHSASGDAHPFERLTQAAKAVAATRKPQQSARGAAPRTLSDAHKSARDRIGRLVPGST